MSVWPAWEVLEHESATSWFYAQLAFEDGAKVDVLAVVSEAGVSIEDVRAQPPLSLDDLAVLAEWIEEPLFEACGAPTAASYEPGEGPARRARPPWPRGTEGRWLVAEE